MVSFETSGIRDSGAQKIPTRNKEDSYKGQRPGLWDKGKESAPAEGEDFVSKVLRGAYHVSGTAADTRVRKPWVLLCGDSG